MTHLILYGKQTATEVRKKQTKCFRYPLTSSLATGLIFLLQKYDLEKEESFTLSLACYRTIFDFPMLLPFHMNLLINAPHTHTHTQAQPHTLYRNRILLKNL